MVNLGFIVEGFTEKMVIRSENFLMTLRQLNLNFIDVIDVEGGGNLLPENLGDSIDLLTKKGADKIIVLTDLEDAPCITSVKSRVNPDGNNIVIIAVRTIEAWFLSDTAAISDFIGSNLRCDHPEEIENPFNFIKEEKIRLAGRGVKSKRLLCSRMLLNGFSLQNAAAHPNCPSATYFLEKLKSLAGVE
jgi:hypothetical protein